LATKYGVPLLIHLAETRRERDDALAKFKNAPAVVLDEYGIFNGRTLAAHGVWLDDKEIAILKSAGAAVAHCPSSNMKLASGVAPVLKLLAAGVPVGLGTDGPAGSNNDFNLFEEMDLASKLQKVTSGDPQALPALRVLEMATVLGARALGMEKEIGSLEPGKRADLIAVRLDQPHAVPFYNLVSQMVYTLKGGDVEDVMVNGSCLLRGRVPLTLDGEQIVERARAYGARVRTSLPRRGR
jgi:5-methylthioadenosine/S-adenosylhomocysteine deaminase